MANVGASGVECVSAREWYPAPAEFVFGFELLIMVLTTTKASAGGRTRGSPRRCRLTSRNHSGDGGEEILKSALSRPNGMPFPVCEYVAGALRLQPEVLPRARQSALVR